VNYDGLLNLCAEMGRQLMESGAEIYRVEDSILRLMHAYQVPDAQVFVIPNCMIVGLTPPDGHPVTRLCRIPDHGTDIGRLEACNDLCRRLCRDVPPLDQAQREVAAIPRQFPQYTKRLVLLGYFLGPASFTLFFGGGLLDTLCGGLCGLVIGLFLVLLKNKIGPNAFFRTLITACVSSLTALILVRLGVGQSVDAITIGALMLLVPGVPLTNAMREVMAGDIISGIAHLAESLLTATAIALGTGVGLALGRLL